MESTFDRCYSLPKVCQQLASLIVGSLSLSLTSVLHIQLLSKGDPPCNLDVPFCALLIVPHTQILKHQYMLQLDIMVPVIWVVEPRRQLTACGLYNPFPISCSEILLEPLLPSSCLTV